MIPTSSSATTNGCDNISSNCVVWQGPDISCIDLCTGDTISEVTAKLGSKVCQIITDGVSANPSLAGLDLTCLNIQGQTPTTLVPVLQAMVTQICLNNTNSGSSISTQVVQNLPVMTLPACLQYNDSSGNPVTELRLDVFAAHVADQVCTNLASINNINTTLTNYENRLQILEACVLPCTGAVVEAEIVPTCVSNIGQQTKVSIVVSALELAFCATSNALGTVVQMNNTIGQTNITSSNLSLENSGIAYGAITGWNASPSTFAQSMQNAWVVIDDLYAAVGNIQTNCCPQGCAAVTFGYSTTSVLGSNGLISAINFNFTTSSIPSTFTDSSGFSLIKITDAQGTVIQTVQSVSTLQNDPNGYNFPIPSTFNSAVNMSVSIDFSVTDGNDTCEEKQSSTVAGVIAIPTPVVSGITTTGATVTFTNAIGTTPVYQIDIIDPNQAVAATYTQNNPSATVSHAFTGLTANTNYSVKVTTNYRGGTKESPLVAFTTQAASAPCSNGMDVVFILDYTGSMGTEIDAIKTDMASLVTTIDTSSGSNNYRIGIVTADEDAGTTSVPAYNACTDYTSLPLAQRIINTGTGHRQFITAWEMFSDNNGTSATTQINKLNGGVGGGPCIQLGTGNGLPEPTDMALGQVIESSAFVGAFRASVAKYVIIITDAHPGGQDDVFDGTDVARLTSLTTTANNAGIKVFVLGPGVNLTYDPGDGSGLQYPWRDIATNTGGSWNVSETPTTIQSEITSGCTPPSP